MLFGIWGLLWAERTATPGTPVEPSLTVNIPTGLTLKNVILLVAENDRSTARFSSRCTGSFLNTQVKEGLIRAEDTIGLITNLNYRLVDPKAKTQVKVTRDQRSGIYDIDCIE